MKLVLSELPKVWLIDLDGTIVKHNGYLNGKDEILPGVKEFFDQIDEGDFVIILTSRDEKYRNITERFLKENGVRYDVIIFNLPHGERVLINDIKPSGMLTSFAINKKRDEKMDIKIIKCPKI